MALPVQLIISAVRLSAGKPSTEWIRIVLPFIVVSMSIHRRHKNDRSVRIRPETQVRSKVFLRSFQRL